MKFILLLCLAGLILTVDARRLSRQKQLDNGSVDSRYPQFGFPNQWQGQGWNGNQGNWNQGNQGNWNQGNGGNPGGWGQGDQGNWNQGNGGNLGGWGQGNQGGNQGGFNQGNQGNRGQTTRTPTTQATTRAPTPAPTTLTPAVQNCVDTCATQTTAEYNPVCGSDNQTYHNPARLTCAQDCGSTATRVRAGACRA